MTAAAPFDPQRFSSAARHYFARGQYAPRLIARVAEECAIGSRSRVMDLGCGPGPLAIAFARYAGEVVGVDPSTDMLSVAREAAAGIDNVRFVEGSSNDLDASLGRFDLVTMGRSFHWMDRADTLRRLDGIVNPAGAVVLFDAKTVREGPHGWHAGFGEIIERHAGLSAPWRSPGWAEHETYLLDSAFSDVEGISVVERATFPAEQLVDRAFSMSRTAPHTLGPEKAAALAADLRALAETVAVDGMVGEIVRSNALIARRP